MNLSQLFEYWKITENPFRGEEARHDAVFARMGGHEGAEAPRRDHLPLSVHSDFEKILGELDRPSTAVVFGEKGSGKTAMRLQIEDIVAERNAESSDSRIFLIPYDDMNGFLDSLHAKSGKKEPLESFKKIRLVDHMDAILSVGVTRLVDATIGSASSEIKRALGKDAAKRVRALPRPLKRDLALLQALYDSRPNASRRTTRLRRRLHLGQPRWVVLSKLAAYVGWLAPAAVVGLAYYFEGMEPGKIWQYGFIAASAAYLVVLSKRLLWDRFIRARVSARVSRAIRVLSREGSGWGEALEQVDRGLVRGAAPGLGSSRSGSGADEVRYALVGRLRKLLGAAGYSGVMVLVDRVDEPTLVAGDPDRMRAIVWPMFDNKFLQLDGVSVKMLLPIELRFALFREPQAFFQKARLDKQNLVERLTWSGAMLYDLCDARLQACLAPNAQPTTLLDLFAEDVTRQDLVDALNEMHQPRDAFKFLYRCMTEHCSNVTKDQNEMRIPRLVVEHTRKLESDRVQELYRGIRPA